MNPRKNEHDHDAYGNTHIFSSRFQFDESGWQQHTSPDAAGGIFRPVSPRRTEDSLYTRIMNLAQVDFICRWTLKAITDAQPLVTFELHPTQLFMDDAALSCLTADVNSLRRQQRAAKHQLINCTRLA